MQSAATCIFGDLNNPTPQDDALAVLTTLGGCSPMPPHPDGDEISHVAHTGALMACDLALCRGAVRVGDWFLGGSQEKLVAKQLPSDHRPLHATLQLGPDLSDEDLF